MTSTLNVAEEFETQSREFSERVRQLGLADVSKYYWYHTIDLGNGLVTPGMYDYRDTVGVFDFPADMSGMNVLDVGSATGFFAFEFERRGANVVSLELPSLEQLDRFPGQRVEQSIQKIERMIFAEESALEGGSAPTHSSRELWELLLEKPFRFCQQRLGSQVQRVYATVYDIQPDTPGVPHGGFDYVFIGDVLLHTLHPLDALANIARLAKSKIVLAQTMPELADGSAAVVYTGGEDPDDDHVSWWLPTKQCMMQLLKKLRFGRIEEVGVNRGLLRPSAYPFERTILRATR